MPIRNRKDLTYLLIISLATLYLWRPLLDLVLQWEGYMYLFPDESKPLDHIANYYKYFNLQGLVLGDLLPRFFGINMKGYFAFELGSILITNIAFFFLAKALLKNSFAAFLASIIFASNYFTIADIHLPNLYAGVFLERLPINIPLMIGSFILLHNYLEQNRIRLYVFSFALYVFTIFISHFSIFFAFPFFCYPFFFRLYKSPKFKNLILSLLLTLPYILIVLFFISVKGGTAPVPKGGLINLLFTSQISHYPMSIVMQLVNISQISIVIKALLSDLRPLAFSTTARDLTPIILPTLITYTASFVFVYKKMKQHRALLSTILFSTLAMLFSNAFIAGRLHVFDTAGSSRYYFIPSIFISIFWAIVLTTILAKKYVITIFIVIVFFIVNAITFRHHFIELQTSTRKTETIINYISQNITKFPQQSLIVAGPSVDFSPYDASFFTYQLGKDRNITFRTEDIGYGDWRPLASSSAYFIHLNFDKQCYCVKQRVVK